MTYKKLAHPSGILDYYSLDLKHIRLKASAIGKHLRIVINYNVTRIVSQL